jgi:hypothetical protein
MGKQDRTAMMKCGGEQTRWRVIKERAGRDERKITS